MSKRIIVLSGGFDPIHKGHIRMFKAAKEFPSIVIVGLNSDSWLTRKKGKPFMPWDERKEILEAISFIDSVYSFNDDDDTACDLISNVLKENKDEDNLEICFGNGGDRVESNSPETDYCNENNIKTLWGIGGEKIQSSSDLIEASKK